jgi:L-fuconate dehydratase
MYIYACLWEYDNVGSLIDYIAISGTMERNVLEYVDHLHEHFVHPCSINDQGRYNVPLDPDEGYRCVAFTLCLQVV